MKKYVSLFLAALTVVAALTVSSVATSDKNVKGKDCDVAYVSINDSEDSANFAVVGKIIDRANRIIEDMVTRELAKPNPDIPKLIARTNIIASNAMATAEKLGAEVECEYTAYEYDGTVFYIDPLIVIRRVNVA